MHRLLHFVFALACFTGMLSACNLKKDIEVDLPAYEHQAVVECYLEQGKPARLLLTQSVSFLDSPIPPLLNGALVTLTYNGIIDTLYEVTNPQLLLDSATLKIANYTSLKPVAAPLGTDILLRIVTPDQKTVTGIAQFITPVPLDTLEQIENNKGEKGLVAYFRDPAAQKNYYLFSVNRNTENGEREASILTDDRLRDGQQSAFGTPYNFKAGDTLSISVYSLQQPFYQYLRTFRDAEDANGNPFAQPSGITATVQGGLGVFATLNYFRKTIIIQ